MPTVIIALLLAASAVLTGLTVATLPFDDTSGRFSPLLASTAALWALFALALLLVRRVPGKRVASLVALGAVAIGGAAMFGPPNTSTDSARYAWDGIVQNAGVSPYAYVPADPALADLRTDWLFPAPATAADGTPYCGGERIMTVRTDDGILCTAINRATVPTIYPPASELAFARVRLLVGPDAEYWPMQLFGLLLSLTVTAILLVALRRQGRDPRWAAMWAWNPLVATEGVTNSHIDILGGLLLLVATVLVVRGRSTIGGVALGVAIAVKLIPVIGAPALLRRGSWKLVVGSVLIFALLYLPYVLSTGIGVLGYLPGYLTEEGYSSGSRFVLLSLVAPGFASTVVAVAVIAVTAALVWWKADDPFLGQLVMIGVTLLVVSPRYAWYALLLVPMIAMTGRWEWLAVPLALTARLLIPSVPLSRVTLAIAIAVVVIVWFRRAGPGAARRVLRAVRHPLTT